MREKSPNATEYTDIPSSVPLQAGREQSAALDPYSLARNRRLMFIRGEIGPDREVLRQEHKFLINTLSYKELSYKLGRCLLQDPHNGDNGYMVRSLYFDTLNNRDYNEKVDGSELRRKFRLRVYDPKSDFAFFEMKQKQGMYQRKRSLRLSREDAYIISKGQYTPLLKYNTPFAAEVFSLLNMHAYRPRSIVQYDRFAFIARENDTRITFDHNITANEGCTDIFSDELCLYPVIDPFAAVLEVKYNNFLLSYIKQLIDSADRSEISVGKYYLARSVTQE